MYNITNITDANTIYEQIKAINDLSGDLFFSLFFFTFFIVLLIVFKKQDFKTVLVMGSFITTIVMTIGFALSFISSSYLIISSIVFFGSLIIYNFIE